MVLQVFYVDRVVLFNRSVSRRQPAIIGWNTKFLLDREKAELLHGGFGFGFVEEQQSFDQSLLLDASSCSTTRCQVFFFFFCSYLFFFFFFGSNLCIIDCKN